MADPTPGDLSARLRIIACDYPLGSIIRNTLDQTIAALSALPAAGGELEWSPTLCEGKRVDYATAAKACAALGEGWRLPTRMELESILDLTRQDPAVDTTRFPDTKSGWYWSSTPCAFSSGYAWIVGFDNGGANNVIRDYNVAFVRAVRSLPATKATTPPPDAAVGAQGDGGSQFGPVTDAELGEPDPIPRNLLTAPAAGKGVDDAWKEAVLDELAVTHMDAAQDEPPAKILARIIEWHLDVARDFRAGHEKWEAANASLCAERHGDVSALTRQPVAGENDNG